MAADPAPDPAGVPLRHVGASMRSQRALSEVRHALTGMTTLPEVVSGVVPQAAKEPKDVAEGAAKAANFRKVRRLVISMNFIDLSGG
jgi:hypothetical protein